ncbi:helix-turn-helix domain-containing protein [Ruegeria sp. HKCCE4150]|uniref:helix-turn-helix domain-containing protein n=1 Tax=Ruegeria sp. HKCCE4150 TaxID=2794828 RepID=UPI0032AF9619
MMFARVLWNIFRRAVLVIWPNTGHEITGTSRVKYPEYKKFQRVEPRTIRLAADLDRSYISEIELAKFSASIDVLERIARALDIAPKELFNERG